MQETSIRGVEVLRILALAIRGDQDYGLIVGTSVVVGATRDSVTDDEAIAIVEAYYPPYDQLQGFSPLSLRQALNKIVHADPRRSGYFADPNTHDLVLVGDDRGRKWASVVSLIDLCKVVQSLPDARTH